MICGLFLILSARDGIAVLRRRKYGTVSLELTRQNFRPLVFHGKICFESPIRIADRSVPWNAIFLATKSSKFPSQYNSWIRSEAPVDKNVDGKIATFELSIDLPSNLPYTSSGWDLKILRADRARPIVYFVIPAEAIFAEEYPADQSNISTE